MDVAESQAKINVGADRESFKAAGLADNRVPEGSRERMSPMLCAADETQLGGTIGFGRRLPIVGGAALDGVTLSVLPSRGEVLIEMLLFQPHQYLIILASHTPSFPHLYLII
jgi:hypothetical protein